MEASQVTCINDWCQRPAHYADGRCKACHLREVWRPAQSEDYHEFERARVRKLAAERRQAARERRAAAPLHFTPPS